MRKFKLWNYAKNEAFDLNSKNHFMSDVKGLGLEYDLTFVETENGEYLDKRKIKNNEISSKLLFMSNPYQKIKEFTEFIYKNDNNYFVFEYNDGIITRNVDVHIQKLSKAEKNEFGVIESDFILRKISPWYETLSITLSGTKKTTMLENYSMEAIPINVEITTKNYTNPKITITDPVSTYTGLGPTAEMIFNYTVTPTEDGNERKIIIDSSKQKIELKYNNHYGFEIIESLYSKLDLTKNTFLLLPSSYVVSGETAYIFDINIPNDGFTTAKIRFRRYL